MTSTAATDALPRVQLTVARISHSPASASACSAARAPTSSKSVSMSVSRITFGTPPKAAAAHIAAAKVRLERSFMSGILPYPRARVNYSASRTTRKPTSKTFCHGS